ncbi:DUF302 domain-containing protein [Granulosicoccus antarcticus]|uniref:DUF302 domain-containing protein n=1 Tax=Granulosicoccus antarcticus IMCC3135 TaxID=1192854 RepID=A0A2Z2NK29_9GAMM|nr:DUF302 domain-containing protein [Granulosicoccus antarcticus]ASJ71752.1 hypothetical protein IMCC3135_08245 [Granulosicoccus antarcticus IMCC3135]
MRALFLGLVTLLSVQVAVAQDGVISVESPFDVSTTLDKLTTVLESKGMTVFARIDHSANAQKADLELRPTQVLIFGNPKIGTPLMNCAQSMALDLPQKMLAWQDEAGNTHLGWNDPAYLQARHNIEGCDEVLQKVGNALGSFAKAATSE